MNSANKEKIELCLQHAWTVCSNYFEESLERFFRKQSEDDAEYFSKTISETYTEGR